MITFLEALEYQGSRNTHKCDHISESKYPKRQSEASCYKFLENAVRKLEFFFCVNTKVVNIRYFTHTAWACLELHPKTHSANYPEYGYTTCMRLSLFGLIKYQCILCVKNQPIVSKPMYCEGHLFMCGQGT